MTRIAPSPVRPKTTQAKDKAYLGFIAALGSEQGAGCACGCGRSPCQVAHVKYGEPCRYCQGTCVIYDSAASGWGAIKTCRDCNGTGWRYGKKHGLRLDRWSLPLFHACHLQHEGAQHEHNEREWWEGKGIDPLALCHELQGIWDNRKSDADAIERGTRAILEARNG